MIVYLVLKAGITGGIGTGLTLEHDRAAVRHDEAGPNQQHTRLTKCNLAIIDTYQSGPLRYKDESPGRAVIDMFGDLGRDLAGQIRADSRNECRRNDIAGLHDIRCGLRRRSGYPFGRITLTQAWERYRDAHLVRKGRSEFTIESYRDHVERIFIEWLDAPLQELGLDPAKVVTKHYDITKENGPYIANGSMRTLRAIYNHARKANKSLPPDNPVNAIDWNGEKRRDTGMGTSDLKGWFAGSR